LAARSGKSVAITATARKIATIFYNTLRYGMKYIDPGACYYDEKYKARALERLRRRDDAFGFTLKEKPVAVMA
jgi:transposase